MSHKSITCLHYPRQCPSYTRARRLLSPFDLDNILFPNERRSEIRHLYNQDHLKGVQVFQEALIHRCYEFQGFYICESKLGKLLLLEVHRDSQVLSGNMYEGF
jgi:hypothetical protein